MRSSLVDRVSAKQLDPISWIVCSVRLLSHRRVTGFDVQVRNCSQRQTEPHLPDGTGVAAVPSPLPFEGVTPCDVPAQSKPLTHRSHGLTLVCEKPWQSSNGGSRTSDQIESLIHSPFHSTHEIRHIFYSRYV